MSGDNCPSLWCSWYLSVVPTFQNLMLSLQQTGAVYTKTNKMQGKGIFVVSSFCWTRVAFNPGWLAESTHRERSLPRSEGSLVRYWPVHLLICVQFADGKRSGSDLQAISAVSASRSSLKSFVDIHFPAGWRSVSTQAVCFWKRIFSVLGRNQRSWTGMVKLGYLLFQSIWGRSLFSCSSRGLYI